jgi:hypothetical protein
MGKDRAGQHALSSPFAIKETEVGRKQYSINLFT